MYILSVVATEVAAGSSASLFGVLNLSTSVVASAVLRISGFSGFSMLSVIGVGFSIRSFEVLLGVLRFLTLHPITPSIFSSDVCNEIAPAYAQSTFANLLVNGQHVCPLCSMSVSSSTWKYRSMPKPRQLGHLSNIVDVKSWAKR